jgi:four helix bundle protein
MPSGVEVKEVKEVNEVKDRNSRYGPVKNYTDLLVYKQAYRLALDVSKFTRTLPREEQFELGRQLRRCARSVPANITEGWTKRNSPAEFKRHLLIAAGENAESKFWIELAADEGFCDACCRGETSEGVFETRIHDSQSLEGVEKIVG